MMHGDFPVDHPVEEVGRLLMALLIKHQGLGYQVITLIDQGKNDDSIANKLGDNLDFRLLPQC
jgi:E3 ubiquitin-protein ligase HERC2